MSKRWYIIHTFSGHENKVKLALEKKVESLGLEEQIVEVRIPVDEVQEVRDGKKKVTSRKRFPGYVFVQMELTDYAWTVVKGIPSVTNFIGGEGGGKPKPLPAAEVAEIFESGRREQEPGGKPVFDVEYSVGEHVKVIEGPFGGFTGLVEDVNPEKGRLKVKVEIFGRATPVDLDFLQVGKV